MVTRQFQGLSWEALGPSDYRLIGFPNIHAYFNGRSWHVHGSSLYFQDMDAISTTMNKAIERYVDNGGNVS